MVFVTAIDNHFNFVKIFFCFFSVVEYLFLFCLFATHNSELYNTSYQNL